MCFLKRSKSVIVASAHRSISSASIRIQLVVEMVKLYSCIREKSGNFGQKVNSDIHLQTVEIQMRWLLMSRLIRIVTVCLTTLLFYSKK